MGILRRHPGNRTEVEVAGEVAYFGLASWWSALFTKTERDRIEVLFQPPGLSPSARPLTTGHKRLDFYNAAALLTAVAGYLREDPADRDLAIRVLAKAEERAKAQDDTIALHLVYQEQIRLHCRWREQFPEAVDLIYGACHKQIAIATRVAVAFQDKRPGQALPLHMGFQMMAVLLEQEESYAQAIELCKQARFQGWSGNWTWRIGTLARKLSEHGNPVQPICPSGLGPV